MNKPGSTRTKSQLSKYARTKGHSFERLVARYFREAGFTEAARQLEYQAGKGVDLTGTEPFAVQCKTGGTVPSPYKILAEIPKKKGQIPLAVHKVTGKDTLVTMKLGDFLKLVKRGE